MWYHTKYMVSQDTAKNVFLSDLNEMRHWEEATFGSTTLQIYRQNRDHARWNRETYRSGTHLEALNEALNVGYTNIGMAKLESCYRVSPGTR